MHKEIILAGFGGQGVMSIGKNLMEAGVAEGLEATWVPSYGPEMRGGTANCSVIISDGRIGSPVIEEPTELIAMNKPSLHKFEPTVTLGGMVFINSDTIEDKVQRHDLKAFYVPCATIANELGNPKVGNMVMLGAYIGATGALKTETIEHMIEEVFTGPKAALVPLNKEALKRGIECVEEQKKNYEHHEGI